jgi:hypothetical protein
MYKTMRPSVFSQALLLIAFAQSAMGQDVTPLVEVNCLPVAGQQGHATFDMVIQSDGYASEIQLVHTTNMQIVESARRAITKFRFLPNQAGSKFRHTIACNSRFKVVADMIVSGNKDLSLNPERFFVTPVPGIYVYNSYSDISQKLSNVKLFYFDDNGLLPQDEWPSVQDRMFRLIADDETIMFAPPSWRHSITALVDAERFSQSFVRDIPELNARGIRVRVVLYARSIDAIQPLNSIWCSANPKKAVGSIATVQVSAKSDCHGSPVTNLRTLGLSLGVSGTPSVFNDQTGKYFAGGGMPPDRIHALLDPYEADLYARALAAPSETASSTVQNNNLGRNQQSTYEAERQALIEMCVDNWSSANAVRMNCQSNACFDYFERELNDIDCWSGDSDEVRRTTARISRSLAQAPLSARDTPVTQKGLLGAMNQAVNQSIESYESGDIRRELDTIEAERAAAQRRISEQQTAARVAAEQQRLAMERNTAQVQPRQAPRQPTTSDTAVRDSSNQSAREASTPRWQRENCNFGHREVYRAGGYGSEQYSFYHIEVTNNCQLKNLSCTVEWDAITFDPVNYSSPGNSMTGGGRRSDRQTLLLAPGQSRQTDGIGPVISTNTGKYQVNCRASGGIG